MAKIDEWQMLAIKGLDLLLLKSLRVSSFAPDEKKWYLTVASKLDDALNKYSYTDAQSPYMKHYALCMFYLQLQQLNEPVPDLKKLKSLAAEQFQDEQFIYFFSESEVTNAMVWALSCAEYRGLDVNAIHMILIELTTDTNILTGSPPLNSSTDFLTSIQLIQNPLVIFDLLYSFLDFKFINQPMLKSDLNPNTEATSKRKKLIEHFKKNPIDYDKSVLVMLPLVEEFNQLCKLVFEAQLKAKVQVIKRNGEPVINSDFLSIFLCQFQTKAAQNVLLNVLNDAPLSLPLRPELTALALTGSLIEGEKDAFRLYKLCFNDYEIKLFKSKKAQRLFRIDKILNVLGSYYVELVRQANFEDISTTLYSITGYSKGLKTITEFSYEELIEYGLEIEPKKLWQSHKELIEPEGCADNALKEMAELDNLYQQLSLKWYEKQFQCIHM